jgi:predicted phage replisome organizer
MKNGHTYSLILIKLYLKSIKYDGQLRVNEFVPYTTDKIDMLASVINHDSDHVMHAVNLAKSLGIVDIVDSGEMFIADIQNYIGHSSTEGDRKRAYRKKITANKSQTEPKKQVGHLSDKRPPELELDIEIEKDIEIELEREKETKRTKVPPPPKHKHGSFNNVLLTDKEMTKLNEDYDDKVLSHYIENLSGYVASTGKSYKSHYATILNWIKKDKQTPAKPKSRWDF